MKIRKILAGVLAGTMALGMMAVSAFADPVPVAVTDAGVVVGPETIICDGNGLTVEFTVEGVESGTATLGFADAAWAAQDWESKVEITGDGTYTITSGVEAVQTFSGAPLVFVVDIPVGDAFDVTTTDYKITSVKVNGTAVDFIYGDLEEKGNLRFEIYNEYGLTKTADILGASTNAADTILSSEDAEVSETGDTETGDATALFVVLAVAALGVAFVGVKKFAFER